MSEMFASMIQIIQTESYTQNRILATLCVCIMFWGGLWLKAYIADSLMARRSNLIFVEKLLLVVEVLMFHLLMPQVLFAEAVAFFYIIALMLVFLLEYEPTEKELITVEENGIKLQKKNTAHLYDYKSNQKYAEKHILYRFFARYNLIAGNRPDIQSYNKVDSSISA
ncbi:MAG: hypothetical protein CFH44_00820 [Proteobacteria bacterium]|nr:MAG: hypothetical protein CFH44_00820 [Pseudomonadota bacterium]